MNWNVTPKEAIELQKKLREKINLTPLNTPVRYIGGADISLNRFGKVAFAGIVVMTFPELAVIETSTVKADITFPYIPGLLSFREIPALLQVWEKLQQKPDVLVIDGQGIAHPRRLGIATHLGLIIDRPTIGVAKNILTGIYDEDALVEVGDTVPLTDSKTKEQIGVVMQTKTRSKPIIISPGHKISLEQSVKTITQCLKGYRIPEPTRQAHLLVNEYRISYN
jgi:deoxyribonuclease V